MTSGASMWQAHFPLGTPVVDQFLGLRPHPTKCQATYLWIDGSGENLRSKTRTLERQPSTIHGYPVWNYDGSSTDQAPGHDSDLILKPVADFADPFLGGQNRLVLCGTYHPNGEPCATSNFGESRFPYKPPDIQTIDTNARR
jgi:glutamine synthetase